jgi:hypothetical protein
MSNCRHLRTAWPPVRLVLLLREVTLRGTKAPPSRPESHTRPPEPGMQPVYCGLFPETGSAIRHALATEQNLHSVPLANEHT